MEDVLSPVKPYLFHGLEVGEITSSQQYQTACPFCEKTNKFTISLVKENAGVFNCFSCGSSGNTYSFLAQLHKESKKATSKESLVEFAKFKKIPSAILNLHGICKSILTNKWLVPIWGRTKSIVNLLSYEQTTNILRGTTQLKQSLYMLESLSNDHSRPILLVEGHWDALVLDFILHRIQKKTEYDILAVPGANSFQPNWLEYLDDREVYLIFDHPEIMKKILRGGYCAQFASILACCPLILRVKMCAVTGPPCVRR